MTDVDAVASAVATGGSPDNPTPATQHNQTDAKGESWGTVDDETGKVVKAKGWKAPADAVKSYVDLEKYASKSVQDMTPEEREKFVKRLGRPESPDGYELNVSVTTPEGFPQRTKDADKEFREVMHKVQTLPLKEQPKAILEWSLKKAVDGFAAQRQAQAKFLEQQESDLRKSWGLDYEANMTITDKAAKLGGDEVVQWLNGGPGKLAVLRKWMYTIGKLMSDDTLETGSLVPRETNGKAGLVFDTAKMGLSKVGPGSR